MTHIVTRRNFLAGCSSTIAALAGSRLDQLAFAQGSSTSEALVVVFLRGGWDAINVVPPVAAGDDRLAYETARPTLKVPVSGTGAALPLDGFFGLHPALASLHSLYQAQHLAIAHATGLTYDTRSHFDAQEYIELGTPGIKTTATGWISRLLSTLSLDPAMPLPALAAGSGTPTSFLGYADTVAISSTSSFNLGGSSTYRGQQLSGLRTMYGPTSDWLDQAGKETIAAVDLIQSLGTTAYVPANGAVYPSGSFGTNLRLIAQMIKANLGLVSATLDLGGWDTHENQGDSLSMSTYMSQLLTNLAAGLGTFYLDLDGSGSANYNLRTTVVVMSEFGRRFKENANRGTDHGHGSVILILGGMVKGGKVVGSWPGLQTEQLYQRADLAVSTDYRRVLSEILNRRMKRNSSHLATIFPGYTQESPLDIIQGVAGPSKVFLPFIQKG